jgi:peroxiredoxin
MPGLVAWWTGPGCVLCEVTAPALNEFHEKHKDQGLAVIGLYHHKSPLPLHVEDVKKQAEKFGFKFPVAIDSDWQTLRRWWLDGNERKFTSVTFLVDKQGVIRHIHRGGKFEKGDEEHEVIRAKIEELLKEGLQ